MSNETQQWLNQLKVVQSQPILLLGATGQLGRAIADIFSAYLIPFAAWDRKHCNLIDTVDLSNKLDMVSPKLIINCSAFTNVDAAETEPGQLENIKLNFEVPQQLAVWCKNSDAMLVHYSTDAVFKGLGCHGYLETDERDPVNAYGMAKARGEMAILESGCRFLIFRTSWVYSEDANNFVDAILKIAVKQPTLSVVNDQWGAPTYAPDLAKASLFAICASVGNVNFVNNIFHITNTGWISRFDLAKAILSGARARGLKLATENILPISSFEISRPAVRAQNSRLSTEKFSTTFDFILPTWQDALERALDKLSSQ